jgi:mono/diheme cytochrome c family protein
MKPWADLFLALPLPEFWLRVLLFVSFGLHLLFVLLMLGTAMIGLFSFLQAWLLVEPDQQPWNKKVMGTHLALKSLAVVLGVAPLLLIQVYYSEAFFTATGLYGFAWLAVIPLLIVAFLSIDVFGHKLTTRPWLPFLFGVLGLCALLTVPAIFTGAMALMERPNFWAQAASQGMASDSGYVTHWIFRYLHILGAAVVFGGVFHLIFSAKDNPERSARLGRVIFAAALFQVVVGVPLLATAEAPLGGAVLTAVTVGAAAAMILAWMLRAPVSESSRLRAQLLLLLPVVLVAMLAARQLIQDGALTDVRAQALSARASEASALAAQQPLALAAFNAKLNTVYDNGKTIYAGSCQPCHGENGLGDGPAARGLLIPAEDLSAIRAERNYLRELLLKGVPGSAMPYFTFFDRQKITSLLDELDARFGISKIEIPPGTTEPEEARKIWKNTCATCHGQDGRISAFGKTLRPAPPDLTRYALTPERTLTVITEGYPGTVMQPYRDLPEAVRTDLARLSGRLRVR